MILQKSQDFKCTAPLSFYSSQASPDSRHLTPLPRRPESRRSEATLPALSSGTGWYQDSGTGAHLSLWCIVGLAVRSLSLRRSCQLHYQSCRLSQEKVHLHWRLLMTGSAAHVPGENTEMYYLNVLFYFICTLHVVLSCVIINIYWGMLVLMVIM